MKMVKLEDETWKKLWQIKLDKRKKSLNDVVEELLKYGKR